PVAGDMAKHPMLNGIPFTRARRKMANGDRQTRLTGELLQTDLPAAGSHAVAAAAIRGHQQGVGAGIGGGSHVPPPTQNGGGGEIGCVVVDAHVDPPLVLRDIKDTEGNDAAQSLFAKIVGANAAWFSGWLPFSARTLEIPEVFSLLGVNGNHRLAP